MFTSARLKLTCWYLLIIMIISISFSIAIYQEFSNELHRVEQAQRRRSARAFILEPQVIEESENRLKAILILVNFGILSISSIAGYFLAGRTLTPIQEMVDEQRRFIADASHELRTPITSLKSELEVNLRQKNIDKNTQKILQSNLEDVNTLQQLSDKLIQLAQYQKGNGVVIETLTVASVIGESIRRVQNIAKAKHITIKNKIKAGNIVGDKQSLTELFVIFLENAIKYSPKNTVITLATHSSGTYTVVDIIDQGIGISNEDIPHIFDRFYRANKSRSKLQIEGFGLGLSIAKQIIDTHQGQVKVVSTPDKGTTFSIFLPHSKRSFRLV